MDFDLDAQFWTAAAIFIWLGIGVVAFNVVYYGALCLRDAWNAWQGRRRD